MEKEFTLKQYLAMGGLLQNIPKYTYVDALNPDHRKIIDKIELATEDIDKKYKCYFSIGGTGIHYESSIKMHCVISLDKLYTSH